MSDLNLNFDNDNKKINLNSDNTATGLNVKSGSSDMLGVELLANNNTKADLTVTTDITGGGFSPVKQVDVSGYSSGEESIKSTKKEDFDFFNDGKDNSEINNIKTDKNRQLAKQYIKEIALVDNDLKDREVRFLVLCKQAWGRSAFD
mgnify:CR=1 FL=1